MRLIIRFWQNGWHGHDNRDIFLEEPKVEEAAVAICSRTCSVCLSRCLSIYTMDRIYTIGATASTAAKAKIRAAVVVHIDRTPQVICSLEQ